MGRKFYYLVTFLLFYLFHLSSVRAADALFPYDGGKTKDGITVRKVQWDGFTKLKGKNTLQVKKNYRDPMISFNVNVPQVKWLSSDTSCS